MVKANAVKTMQHNTGQAMQVTIIKHTRDPEMLSNDDELLLTFLGETNAYYGYDKPLKPTASQTLTFNFKAPVKPGKYRAVFSIRKKGMFFLEFNSLLYNLEVK
ncbi:MAG: hypothetical protein JKY70_14300 [Mucilaginibacter sp.]|nr:hypothetical protein [Mucilaginibacter sp.]